MIRAFIGIELDAAVRSALAVQQFLLPLPQKVPLDQMHLTLCFLGEVPDAVVEAVHEGLSALRHPRFALEVRGAGLFGGPKPRAAWAGIGPSDPLVRLQGRIDRVARVAGAVPQARRFVPHITLGRFAPPGSEETMRLERGVAEAAGFRAGPWQVEDVVLWRSHPGGKGTWHEELARYPLT